MGGRDVAASAGLIAELEGAGRKVLPVELDIPKKAHIAQAIDAAVSAFGRIDVLVNNVGVAPGNIAELVEEKDLDGYSMSTSRAPS